MPLITIASVNVPNWQRDSDVELRAFADKSFAASDGTLIVKGDPSEDQERSDNWFLRGTCSLAGSTLTVNSLELYSTTDSDQPDARWQAWFFTAEGERIGPFGEFQRFALPETPTATTWAAIAAAQEGLE
jgi:hypothetical protein